MILIDSSAWIEFLRGSDHAAHRTVRHLLAAGSQLATTEVVVMELMAGVSAPRNRKRLRDTLLSLPLLRLRGLSDFEAAADLYRACRAKGASLRGLSDCLIATVAVREGASVLHNDRDFEAIARHSRLKLEPYIK